MTVIAAIPFTTYLPQCPKCNGNGHRQYCDGATVMKECSSAGSALLRKEHFDVTCQECRYQFYQQVKEGA